MYVNSSYGHVRCESLTLVLVEVGLDGEHQGKKIVTDRKLLLMPPFTAVGPHGICNLWVHGLLVICYSLVVDFHEVILEDGVLVTGGR